MPYIGRSNDFGVRTRYTFTSALGGETSLSGSDDNGKVLKIADVQYADLYLNGVMLVEGDDYTANATSVSGLTALTAGDVVEIVTYDIFNVADTVPASIGGEFSGGIESQRYQNKDTYNEDLTIASGKNAMLVGPVTLNGTVTVNGTLTVV